MAIFHSSSAAQSIRNGGERVWFTVRVRAHSWAEAEKAFRSQRGPIRLAEHVTSEQVVGSCTGERSYEFSAFVDLACIDGHLLEYD